MNVIGDYQASGRGRDPTPSRRTVETTHIRNRDRLQFMEGIRRFRVPPWASARNPTGGLIMKAPKAKCFPANGLSGFAALALRILLVASVGWSGGAALAQP